MNIIFDYPTADEFKFILDSWSNSFRKSPYAGCVPNNLWPEVSRSTATQLMSRKSAQVIVALAPTDSGERGRVMGYYVAEPDILHWLYVKKDYRKLGIGKQLLKHALTIFTRGAHGNKRYTHKTNSCYWFLPSTDGWKWDTIPARIKA